MSEEWGPWIEHDGRGCSCVGCYVEVASVDQRTARGIATGGFSWYYGDAANEDTWERSLDNSFLFIPIIRYRIRKPKAMTMIEEVESRRKGASRCLT